MLRGAGPTPRIGYSRREIAETLGISTGMVIELVKRGELPSFRLGNKVFVPAAAIQVLVDQAMANYRPEPVMARLVGLSQDPKRRRRPA